jgi:hypothetical protein
MDVAAATGAKVGEPQPEVENVAGVETTICPGAAGKLSVKFNPEIATGFVFVIVKLSVEVPPTEVGSGEKLLLIVTPVLSGSRMYPVRVPESKLAL